VLPVGVALIQEDRRMAKLRRVILGHGAGWNFPLLLTSIGMALGLFVISHHVGFHP
jgi:hypothetical protein